MSVDTDEFLWCYSITALGHLWWGPRGRGWRGGGRHLHPLRQDLLWQRHVSYHTPNLPSTCTINQVTVDVSNILFLLFQRKTARTILYSCWKAVVTRQEKIGYDLNLLISIVESFRRKIIYRLFNITLVLKCYYLIEIPFICLECSLNSRLGSQSHSLCI